MEVLQSLRWKCLEMESWRELKRAVESYGELWKCLQKWQVSLRSATVQADWKLSIWNQFRECWLVSLSHTKCSSREFSFEVKRILVQIQCLEDTDHEGIPLKASFWKHLIRSIIFWNRSKEWNSTNSKIHPKECKWSRTKVQKPLPFLTSDWQPWFLSEWR